MYKIQEFVKEENNAVIQFLQECLAESGRSLDLQGRHKMFSDIEHAFKKFYCLFDDDKIIGTVALKELDADKCELKTLYLLESYQGQGLGKQLLQNTLLYAKHAGYKAMYLDTISTSTKAISLYKKMGFVMTERYNNNYVADVFMVLPLSE